MALTVGDLREETTWRELVPLSRILSTRKIGQLWLHHTGHDKSRGYGSRLFAWQMDAVGVGEAAQDQNADVSFKLTWEKSRRRTPNNRADFAAIHIRLAGGEWTAEQLEHVHGRGPVRLNNAGTIAVNALEKALAAAGERPPGHDMLKRVTTAVTLKTWRQYFSQVAGYDDTPKSADAERMAFNRGKENALASERAKVWGDWAWLPC